MIYLLRLGFLVILVGSTCAFAQSKKKTVAVLEFSSTSREIGKDELATLTNRFRTILVKTDSFVVLERQTMHDILKEQDFIMSDNCNSAECAVQVGQLLGVELMIGGDIGKLGSTHSVDLRLIDVTTGKIVQSESQDHDGKIDGLFDVLTIIAKSFAKIQKLPVSVETLGANNEASNSIETPGAFIDHRDGQKYKTVKIGDQIWMAENLNYDVGNGCACYDEAESNCEKYGKLYNNKAAKRAVPSGWHLPSKDEWESLLASLRATGKDTYEQMIDGGGSGFNALFGGTTGNYKFTSVGVFAGFWSSTAAPPPQGVNFYDISWALRISGKQRNVSFGEMFDKQWFSVRCVKD